MQSIRIEDHTLTWEEHSQGEHTYLFVHGYSANRAIWSQEVKRFAPLGRCVTLDLPGHYPAQGPAGYKELSPEQLLRIELAAIQQIVGQGRATIIGHSTGGMVALAAAARLPQQIARSIAIAPVVWGPLGGILGFGQKLLQRGGYPIYWANYWLTQRLLRFMQRGIAHEYSGDAKAYLRNSYASATVQHWYGQYRHSRIANLAILLNTLRSCDIRALIPTIASPVLVIAGARDKVVPLQQARWLRANLSDVELCEIPTAGHVVHWEAAEEVHQRISAWLKETEQVAGA